MDIVGFLGYAISLITAVRITFSDLNLMEIFRNVIIFSILFFILSVFLVVYFDKNVIERFFSNDYKEYFRPLIFYLSMLVLIQLINIQYNFPTIFFEMLFIIVIVKLIGLINIDTGSVVLQILGGFTLIELILSPIGEFENIEPNTVISLSLTSLLLFCIVYVSSNRLSGKIILCYKKTTNHIINFLI